MARAKKSFFKTIPAATRCGLMVLFSICFMASAGCQTVSKWTGQKSESNANQSERVKELEVGYDLLNTTLAGEAELKWLLLFKKVTLKEPTKRVKALLQEIQQASEKRAEEIVKLRKLHPIVSGKPAPSIIGDAIQKSATDEGTREMIFSDGSFNIRFVFLQAQATRMISVIAKQTALIDTNPKRQEWLNEVSKQYEGLRNQLVDAFERCTPH